MFKFNGTLSELKTYLDCVFTKRVLKTLQLGAYAHNQTVQARGTYTDVKQMLRLVFTYKHLQTLSLSVDVYQPAQISGDLSARILSPTTPGDYFPCDITLKDVHATLRAGHVITALKAYRQLTGVGLQEAKDYIDKYRDENGISRPH